eukprot:scaffold1474_cov132-Cylindrotheca_fusiformis.AAC.3
MGNLQAGYSSCCKVWGFKTHRLVVLKPSTCISSATHVQPAIAFTATTSSSHSDTSEYLLFSRIQKPKTV